MALRLGLLLIVCQLRENLLLLRLLLLLLQADRMLLLQVDRMMLLVVSELLCTKLLLLLIIGLLRAQTLLLLLLLLSLLLLLLRLKQPLLVLPLSKLVVRTGGGDGDLELWGGILRSGSGLESGPGSVWSRQSPACACTAYVHVRGWCKCAW